MKTLKYLVGIVLAVIIVVAVGYQFLTSQQSAPPTPSGALQVTFLDVGQADAVLIQSGSNTMLIDAGSNSTADSLVANLKNRGISKFDVITGTHPHEDHIGGLDAVINAFDIGQIYMPKVAATTKTFEDVLDAIKNKNLTVNSPVPGSSFNLGSATVTILAPQNQGSNEINDYSIVMRLHYGNTSFLFTGDAEEESEKEMLARGYTLKSDVLKVGHHGSTSSTSDAFLNAVSPRYAVIFVGRDNEYGHPHRETLDKLNKAGVKVLRTDLNGTISFTSDGANLTVKSEK